MTATVRAVRVDEPFQVDTPGGQQRGEAGDYLAVGVAGERYRIAASYLDAFYAPVE